MSRLIDADKLTEYFYKVCWKDGLPKYLADGMARVIDDQPTEVADPIVRCKECIFWHECRTKDKFPFKKDSCNKFGIKMEADDFCSRGKRE